MGRRRGHAAREDVRGAEAHVDAYREHSPGTALAHWVECFWTSDVPAGGRVQRVLPDGCVDILFDLDGGEPRVRLVGAMSRPLVVPPSPTRRRLGIRFHPGGAARFLARPVHEWTDEECPLAEVWPGAEAWLERVLAGRSTAARLALVERELERALPRLVRPSVQDERARFAIDRIRARPSVVRVEGLAREVGVSRQYLGRVVKGATGLSPKKLASIVRLRALLASLPPEGPADWATTALEAGYCDQAHLIGDFRRFAGTTPTRWLSASRSPGDQSAKTSTADAFSS